MSGNVNYHLQMEETLKLARCPHCAVDKPHLATLVSSTPTKSDDGRFTRQWKVYYCKRCGGAILTGRPENLNNINEIYPSSTSLDNSIPLKVKAFLQQALDTIHAPAASIMVCCSAVDEMLKVKGYTEGKIYPRINKAAADHLLTDDMAKWAHQVRLDANDQRHADAEAELPTTTDAERTVTFALALGEFLFVLPSKITRGIEETKANKKAE